MSHDKDPIAALATPIGEGAIAVIRISGHQSIERFSACFTGKNLRKAKGYSLHFGNIVDADQVVDEVLVSLFRAPRSYTGEDSVEVSCHGGLLVTQKVLETIYKQGIRPAEPGEFTKRAFLNGKMELSQAEAVADVIHAQSVRALDAASRQLSGKLGDYVAQFRQQIIDMTALIELELDFTEEDVEFASREQLKQLISDLDLEIDKLKHTYDEGRLIKDGVKTVFVGKPNAGKSTLLNQLVGHERAIVSETAGTTRDTIDAQWSHEGVLFMLTDTAGIRSTSDQIEEEGVKRTLIAVERSDLVVHLIDATDPDDSEDVAGQILGKGIDKPMVNVVNKADLVSPLASLPNHDVKISAKTGEGIKELKSLMKQKTLGSVKTEESSLLVTSSRHFQALEKTQQHLRHCLTGLEQGLTGDLLSIDLRAALQSLGTITGEITNEDVLDSIFSRFCIGK